MRINSISNVFFAQNNKKTDKNQKTTFNSIQDTISFSKQANAQSLSLLQYTQNKETKDYIKTQIITNGNGEYQQENDIAFYNAFDKIISISEKEGEDMTPEFFEAILDSLVLTFKNIKEKDGFNLENDIASIAYTVFNAKDVNFNDEEINEVLQASKTDGIIEDKVAYAVFSTKNFISRELPTDVTLAIIGRYIVNPKTEDIDEQKAQDVLTLFDTSMCTYFQFSDMVYSLTLNKNYNYDKKRCEFATWAFEKLNYSQADEISPEVQEQFGDSLLGTKFFIIKQIIDTTVSQNKRFDTNKAKEAFEDWYNYSADSRYKHQINDSVSLTLENESTGTKKSRKLSEIINLGTPMTEIYKSTLFRMFALLNKENGGSKLIN